jgi:cysteinyl-tRNA synthetase
VQGKLALLLLLCRLIGKFSQQKDSIMQALREIHEVTSDTITIQIPKKFPYKQVEIIVLPVEGRGIIDKANPWETTNQIREQLERSGRTFSDSAELIQEDRG